MKLFYSLFLAVTTTAYPWEDRFNPISMQNQMPNFDQFGGNNLGGGVSPDSPGTQPIDDNGATDNQIGNGAGIGPNFDIGGGNNGGNGDGSMMNGDDSFYNPYQIGRGTNDDNGQGMNDRGTVWQIGNGVGMGGEMGGGMGGGMGRMGRIAGQGMGDYDTGDDMGDNGRWKRQTVDVENGMIGGSAGIRKDNQGSGYNPMRMQNQIPNINQISANNEERHGALAYTSNDGSNGYQIGNGAGIGPNYDIGGGNNGGNGEGGGDDSFYNPYQIGQGTGIMGGRRKRETIDMGNVLIGRNTGMRSQRMRSGMMERT